MSSIVASSGRLTVFEIAPEMNGYMLRFNVHFKDHRVARTSQSVVYPDRRFLWD